ncbi:MAG: TonB-dependent receptor [Proteobacteria bacterium]|nr:TonB-dependent receptor [Pseudomonadota bacterium]
MKSMTVVRGLYGAVLAAFGALSLTVGAPAAAQEQAASESSGPIETIVVSARKREESIAAVPTSITAFTAETLKDYNIESFGDYASKTPNMSFSYGGGPTGIADARTIAIRGITGQNLFGTAGATGFYIDDTPVPGSIDPRVVDLASIEVLKGPQGTLYGESSLGGNVRLITHQPNLTENGYGLMGELGATSGGGSADGGGNLIGNIVLVPGTAALRVVLFGNHDAGYLTRTYPSDPNSACAGDPFASCARTSVGDQGAMAAYGGSAALLWKFTDALDVKLRVMFQDSTDHGFPTAFAPLPGFSPQYTIDRAFNVQSHASDSWTMPTLDIKYSGSGWQIVWANSYFYRHTQDVEDSSYGTQQVLNGYYQVVGLPSQPYLWDGEHHHDQVSSELRYSFDPIHNVSGTFGLYYANTHSRFTIPPTYAQGLTNATVDGAQAWPTDEIWTQTNPGTQEDKSIFGELYWKFLPSLTATFGARGYWLNQTTDYTADGFMNFGPTPSAPQSNSQSGINPKAALSFQASDEVMVYGSASKGFRAGGAQPFLTFCEQPGLPVDAITHLKSDTLWTYEVGTKVQLPRFLISAAAYDIEWSNLQQQVGLACGYYLQVNGGKARIRGGEIEANGRIVGGLNFRLGLGYEDTNVTDPGALGSLGVLAGSRISGVPAFTGSVGAVYSQPITSGGTDGFLSADYSYTGNSVALLVGGAGSEATRAGYSLLNARVGVSHGLQELALNFRNITNSKPNLGDIGYVGYAQYNQAGNVIPQAATLQPFTVTLQYTKSIQ